MQEGPKDCGLASLLMILKYYNGNCSLEYLKSLTDIDNDGLSMYTLQNLGNKLGFSCKGVKGNYLELKKNMLPCIAHVKLKKSYLHYIVIYKINKTKKNIYIVDPSKGLKKMSFVDFNSIKTDNYLLFKLNKNPIYITSESKILNICFNYLKENLSLIIYLTIISIIITVLTIVSSFRLEAIVNMSIATSSYQNLIAISFVLISLILLKETSIYFKNHLLNYFLTTIDYKLVITIYEKLLSLSRGYYKNHSTGEVLARVQDQEKIKCFIVNLLATIITDTITFIITLLTLFYLNYKLTIIIIITTFILIFLYIINKYSITKYLKLLKNDNANITSFLTESIIGIDSIKNLGIETNFINKFQKKYLNFTNEVYLYQNLIIKKDYYLELATSISEFLIIIIGSAFIINNNMKLETLITYLLLLTYIYNPVKNQIELLINYFDSKLSYKRINDLLLLEEKKKKHKRKINLTGNIKISNLNYSYQNEECLKNINIEIKKGERILISGKSGSGKSTLAKIISGIIYPRRNTVFIDGVDILDINKESIRNLFSFTSQNEVLFTDTLYNNIDLYRNIKFEEIIKISKLTLVNEIASKNNLAYNMLIEEDGYNISGGEKARIILARNILKQSEIYILDEIFSAVDVERERKILENLFNKFKDKTIIVISHRFYNDDLFDRKLVINEGIISERN